MAGLLPAVLGMSSPAAAEAAPAAPGVSAYALMQGTIVLSPSDAWIVGWEGVTDSTELFSVAFHWNGHTWTRVSSATPGAILNGLQGVSATGPSDVWGVGFEGSGSFVEHYNGRTWATVANPADGQAGQLNGVDARTRSDAWAVGWTAPSSSGIQTTLAEHWNGRRWAQVAMPSVSGSFPELNSVLDLGPGNVLAVGDYQTTSRGTTVSHELAEHWNGRAWRRVGVPALSTGSFLMGISGETSTGVTAVGAAVSGGHNIPLIEHWTGTRFVRVTQPVSSGEFNAVTVVRRTDAYAVGQTDNGKTFMEHYNGKRWTAVSTPGPGDDAYFVGVGAATSGSFVEAVGTHGPSGAERYLIVQGNGPTWHIAHQ